jgi:hypothetical protein
MTITMVELAQIIDGKHEKYKLHESIQHSVHEGSMCYYFGYGILFSDINKTEEHMFMAEAEFSFPIDGEGWEELGHNNYWFEEYDENNSPLQVFEMELKKIEKWVKK